MALGRVHSRERLPNLNSAIDGSIRTTLPMPGRSPGTFVSLNGRQLTRSLATRSANVGRSGPSAVGSGTFSYNDLGAGRRAQQAVQAQTDANFRALHERHAGAMQALGGLIQTKVRHMHHA